MDMAALSTGALQGSLAEDEEIRFAGRGVTVAIFDSGVSPSSDFGANASTLVTEVDFTEPDGRFSDPFGHGTHVAGIIAGSGDASATADSFRTFRGVAPGTRILSVKVLDHLGRGNVREVLAGIDWAIRYHEHHDIRVLVLPLGHPVDESHETDPLCEALEMAWEAGITVVVSAGNSGGGGFASITSPGNDPRVITVGAAEDWDTPESSDDIVASFSSRGPTAFDGVIKPDLIAPGTNIISLRSPGSYLDTFLDHFRVDPVEYRDHPRPEEIVSPYASLSGTSMAASIVAGAAAILLEQDPEATPDDIKARLMIGTRKIDDAIISRGAGLLDISASLNLGEIGIVVQDSRSPSMLVLEDEDGETSVQIQDIGASWGDPFTWISPAIWGETFLWGVSDHWMGTSVWQDGSSWDSPVRPYEIDMAVLSNR
jgi:serine protease AprX